MPSSQLSLDPAVELRVGVISIHAGETGLSAALAPADATQEHLGGGVDDRPAAVAVARIFTTSSRAEHAGRDTAVAAIIGAARSPVDDWNRDLAQIWRNRPALAGSAPADNGRAQARRGLRAGRHKCRGRNGGRKGQRSSERQDGDVVVDRVGVVLGMHDLALDRYERAARVVLQRADAEFERRGRAVHRAMSGCQDLGRREDGAAADEAAGLLQIRDEGVRRRAADHCAADDLGVADRVRNGIEGSCRDEDGAGEAKGGAEDDRVLHGSGAEIGGGLTAAGLGGGARKSLELSGSCLKIQ